MSARSLLSVLAVTSILTGLSLASCHGDAADLSDPADTSPTLGDAADFPNAGNTPGTVAVDANALPLSRLVGGAAYEPNHYWPPTGQICEVTLGGAGRAPAQAPQALRDSCAACHGLSGDGLAGVPGIKRARDYTAFAALVRQGYAGATGEMPGFASRWLNEPDLQRIYAYAMQVPLEETGRCTPRTPADPANFAATYAAGLAMWRKQDGHVDPAGVKSNVACIQCHAADPLDIAYYGFVDGDVLRRGNQHLPVAEVAPIVDMVHALRDRYAIGRREPLVSRPFQPGGALLPGDSIAERDAAFGAQLQAMDLRIVSAPIASVADAKLAYAQLANVDMHMLRIPVPFNHYSEDVAHNGGNAPIDCDADIDNCRDHGSIADWMPSSPHVPADWNAQLRAMDAYLQNPNAATFAAYKRAIPSQDTMPGTFAYGTRGLEGSKYRAQTLANYCLQREVRGLPGCYDLGVAPFPNQADIWDVGATVNLFGTGYAAYPACDHNWTSCADAPAKLPRWPDHLLADLTPGSALSGHFSRLRHTWMTTWWVHFDPTLLVTGDPTAQKDEYFTRSLFWANLNDWQFSATPQQQARPAYATFAAWQVAMHNVAVLQNPNMSSCSLYPAIDFNCTQVDLRSGYFPNVINFAEQNQAGNPESVNNINYQLRFQPKDPQARATYQMLTANMYRMFFYLTIDALQHDAWMCRADLQRLRMARAKKFLDAIDTLPAADVFADAAMLQRLDALLAGARVACPPL